MKKKLKKNKKLEEIILQVAEVAQYLWQKGWAERNAGNISVNIDHLIEGDLDEISQYPDFELPEPYPESDQAGTSVLTVVETVDLYPTILELCNVTIPFKTDGESFAALILNPAIHKDDVAYSYFRQGISVRTSRYRLTKYFRNEMPVIELYDYLEDPYETKNLASDKPEIVKELLPVLEKGNTGLFNTEN
ncbi:MAG: DUF4976 domain-containing protein [Bacteroidetes bacterium]|nr:DUF4976 domain-containing protein [Bacteroidota bacterium]